MSALRDAFLGKPSCDWLLFLVTRLVHLKFFSEFQVPSGSNNFFSEKFDEVFEFFR